MKQVDEKHNREISEVKGLLTPIECNFKLPAPAIDEDGAAPTVTVLDEHAAHSRSHGGSEIKEADYAFWGGPFCGECGATVAACTC